MPMGGASGAACAEPVAKVASANAAARIPAREAIAAVRDIMAAILLSIDRAFPVYVEDWPIPTE